MTTYFETTPKHCPMCGVELRKPNASVWASGAPYDCRRCGFEYAKALDQDTHGLDCGCSPVYFYQDRIGEWGCMQCERAQFAAQVRAADALIERLRVRIDDLESMQKADMNRTKAIAHEVIEMIRTETRQAVIDTCTLPIGELEKRCPTAKEIAVGLKALQSEDAAKAIDALWDSDIPARPEKWE